MPWVAAAIGLAFMAFSGPIGIDVPQCWTAIRSVGQGGSPYTEGIAALTLWHNLPAYTRAHRPPLIYWYSPLTIPVLRLLALIPTWVLAPVYGCICALGFLMQLNAAYRMGTKEERVWLRWLLPFAAFFPGLLFDNVVLSGNVAVIFYGLILAAAIRGWERNRWHWFYFAVIAASICKTPMLTLLLFPVLVGRKQWAPASIAGFTGVAIFAVQPLFWPVEFHRYLLTVRLVFDWTRDFGFGPAGLLSKILWEMKRPYSSAGAIAYALWTIGLSATLLALSRRKSRIRFSQASWVPIALVGTVLINPRINYYDTLPLAIPLLLVAWRSLRLLFERARHLREDEATGRETLTGAWARLRELVEYRPNLTLAVVGLGCFTVCNIADAIWGDWAVVELLVLLSIFGMGCWSLHYRENEALVPARSETEVEIWREAAIASD